MDRPSFRLARPAAALAGFAALGAVAASAQDPHVDSVDLQVATTASVKGTIRGVDERESLALLVPEGAVVKASAKRRGKGRLVPLLDFVDGADALVPSTVVTKGKGTRLTTSATTASGIHKVRVFGDGTADGDYTLGVTTKPRAKWTGTGGAPAAAFPITYSFGAPAGAAAKIVLKPAKNSAFVPGLEALLDGDGAQVQALSGGTTGFIPLPATGRYTVGFHNASMTDGDWTIQVTLKLPKVRKSVVDISAGKLTGQFVDGQAVYGRLAGDGASLEVIPDLGGALDGASITLQQGSLPVPVVITMSESPPFDLPDGQNPVGPTIQFGPEGTTFTDGKPATLSMPYDPALDPDSLTIYVRDETNGNVVAVPKPYEFPEPGIVSFPAPHFSQYVTTSFYPPEPNGDWVLVQATAEQRGDWGGNTSFESGVLSFGSDATFGGWVLATEGVQTTWYRDFYDEILDVSAPRAFVEPKYGTDGGGYETGLQQVYLYGRTTYGTLNRSDRNDVLLRVDSGQEYDARVTAFLRKARGNPTALNVQGRWQVIAVSAGAREDTSSGTPGPVSLATTVRRATATFTTDGKIAFSGITGQSARTDFPAGSWSTGSDKSKGTGSFVTQFDRVGVFLPGVGGPAKGPRDVIEPVPDVWLRVALDGDVMVGTTNPGLPAPDEAELFLFVREASGFSEDALASSNFQSASLAWLAVDRLDGVQGYAFETTTAELAHDKGSGATVRPIVVLGFEHDPQGFPTYTYDYEQTATQYGYSLASNGAWALDNGLSGWLTRSKSLLVATKSSGANFQLVLSMPFVPIRSKR
jgi:hypothetical protein